MVTLANLDKFVEKNHQVTVIGPSPYHYYSGMGPGMLGKTYKPDDIRFATRHLVEKKGGTFVQGKAARVDPEEQIVFLDSGDTIPYDVVSFNAGSQVPLSKVKEDVSDLYCVKPIEKLIKAQTRIVELVSQKKIIISIIGGGPSSAEIAGNVWRLTEGCAQNKPLIRILAGQKFMSRFPDNIRQKVMASLTRRGVEISENGYVSEIASGKITLESGTAYSTDFIFLALGVRPSPIFKASGLPTGADGGLSVNKYLQSANYPNIFGGGDCICFEDQPLHKVGVYAVRQNPVLYHNLMASLDGDELMPFDPGGDYLLIFNLGDGTGVLRKNRILFGGRPAFMIKDYIDRKFIKEFQAFEN